MRKIYSMLLLLLVITKIEAQQKIITKLDTTIKEINLEEVIISATNFTEKIKNIAQKIDIITANTIALTNAQNTGDLLQSTGKIFVQKSQQGGSSPVIRGFEASRILLIIDGVRMNNAIYRSGHLQNSITVDQNSLSRVEVLYGPSSAIYGSDALGGAVHLITKGPIFSNAQKLLTTGSGFVRYSNVNEEKTMHIDASIGNKKFAWFQAYNFSNFGDMRMGSEYQGSYPNFGTRSNYITSINGIDSVIKNNDDRVQKYSGYKQWDITQKFAFKQSEKITHQLNLQLSNTTNVPRYDRLQDIRNGTLRYAEWYYGPQKRILGAYEFNADNVGFFNNLKANINYQNIEESRITREYRRYDRLDSRIEKVKVFGATIAGRKIISNSEFTGGIDIQLNDVQSTATRKNQLTGALTKLDTRYPDGLNKMNTFAVFIQHVYKFKNEKMVLNDGIRLQTIALKSNIADNSFFKLPDTSVKQTNTAVTANIGLVYTPIKKSIIKINFSSGFRAPNIDDLAKVFESSTAAKQVVLPNANLKLEYTYNIDVSLIQKVSTILTFELTGFYTKFTNAIVKAPFVVNGQDSILYNGIKSQVLASQNINKANVYGITASIYATISNQLSFNTTLTYTKGEFEVDATKLSSIYEKQPNGAYAIVNRYVSKRPLDHIPPIIGKTAFNYKTKKINSELFFIYNGWKRLEQYNTDGEDNAQYATQDGMPAWVTTNVRATIQAIKNVQIQVSVENIFDTNYRYFASGFSAGGRNFVIGIRANW